MRVKPNPNKKVGKDKLKVYDPIRREFLPENGRDVPRTAYWLRRLQVGDVVPAGQSEENTKQSATPTAPKTMAGKAKAPAKTKAQKAKSAKQPAKSKADGAKAPEPVVVSETENTTDILEPAATADQPASNKE